MRVRVRVVAAFLVGGALFSVPIDARAKAGQAAKKGHGRPAASAAKHFAVQHAAVQHEGGRRAKPGDASAVARLGRGTRLFEEADYDAAQKELTPLAKSSLLNRDTALYLLATSEALQIPPAREAALAHFHQLAAMQNSRWTRLARARAADVAFDLGRSGEANEGYLAVLAHPAAEVEPAVARFRLAVIAEQKGDRKAAVEGFLKVFDEHPFHPLADRALARLKALDPRFVPSPEDRIARAQRLTAAHGWQRSLDELSLLPRDLSRAARDQADYQIGMTHFKMRHGYDVAAEKLLAVWPRLPASLQSDALFHGARAWSRANQDDRAIAGYRELLARFPRSKQAPEAAFLVGWLDFNRGKWKEALPGLTSCLAQYGSSSFADDAHWYLGFSKWMLGDVSGALAEFEWMSKRSGALDGGKGRYWKGRALLSLGKKAEAIAEWKRLAGDYAFSYYALSARVRLAEQGIPTDVFGGVVADRGTGAGTTAAARVDGIVQATSIAIGESAARPEPVSTASAASAARVAVKRRGSPPLPSPDETLAKDADVARTDELLAAGLGRDAAAELDRVDGALVGRYGAARTVPLLIDRYERAEDFFHVHRLAEAHAGAALHNDPAVDGNARAWWEKVYPLAYRRFVEKYGPSGANPPYYLYTIMQKESAYNPHDLSYADAIGLLQMIPPTSRRVGERIGRPYTDDVLYDPEGNIQFGAWYIGHLLEKFKGQVALGAGSYNAGPKAMMRWLGQNGARPLDEFIELCSYTQTREYMKKVLDIYAHYEWLYARRDYLPDEKIDPKFVENEIDY